MSIVFIILCAIRENKLCSYDTKNIRGDTRGALGMFDYKSKVERKREQLKNKNTKF